jgi:ABC-type uncharacterized transport system ATPase subunit
MTASKGDAFTEIIRTRGLTKVYPGTDFATVDQLDLTVHSGEIFGLLGPNGAGACPGRSLGLGPAGVGWGRLGSAGAPFSGHFRSPLGVFRAVTRRVSRSY